MTITRHAHHVHVKQEQGCGVERHSKYAAHDYWRQNVACTVDHANGR